MPYERQSKPDEARQAYQQALVLDPGKQNNGPKRSNCLIAAPQACRSARQQVGRHERSVRQFVSKPIAILGEETQTAFWKAAVWQESGLTSFRKICLGIRKSSCGTLLRLSTLDLGSLQEIGLPSGAWLAWSSPLQVVTAPAVARDWSAWVHSSRSSSTLQAEKVTTGLPGRAEIVRSGAAAQIDPTWH